MRIAGLTAELIHDGDEVQITLRMPALQLQKLVDGLKKPTKAPKPKKEAPDLKARRDELYAKVKAWQDLHPNKHPAPMLVKFMRYWGEPDKTGKKIRYDGQEFFDIGGRLATFRQRTKPDELNQMWEEHNKMREKEARQNPGAGPLFNQQATTT